MEADEVVARIETDKVTVDILAQHSGVITKFFAEEGDTVEVGAEFLEIDTSAKGGSAPPQAATPAPEPKQEAPAQVGCDHPLCLILNNYMSSVGCSINTRATLSSATQASTRRTRRTLKSSSSGGKRCSVQHRQEGSL